MLPKADSEAVRRQNRRIALEHVRRWQRSTRRRLSQDTGLSMSGAAAIATDLVREGLLKESLAVQPGARRGRPEIELSVDAGAARIAAVKIAVGEVSVSVADYAGSVLATRHTSADLMAMDGTGLVELVAGLAATAIADTAGGPLKLVVVAAQGVCDAESRRLLWSPIVGTREIDLGSPLRDRLGAPVVVMNDCGLMPERFRWSGGGVMRDFATLFIGFGVGMGLRLGGTTFRGSHSSAVEFGHMNHIPGGAPCRCGNAGCIEAYAGDYAILRAATGEEAGKGLSRRVSDVEMQALADSARAGDMRARAAFERAGEALGYGLGRLFTLIDPLPVAFVGSGAHAMDLIEPSIRQAIALSAIEGVGADIPFQVYPDVDAVLLEASIAFALAAVDDRHAVPGNLETA